MEIPPSSSFAQSTAFFSGLSRDDVTKSILSIGPEPERNSLLHSNNVKVAASMTGELQDFKYDDYREAYRMMNGPPKYPFQSIAQISNSKFDPYYFDGSENDPNFNVNENLIGTPLGTSLLEDPRLSYVKNIMTLKEYQGRADQLNDTYLKELYMVNTEKGSNYYINMLERQQQALEYWSREGRASKNKTIPGIAFTYNLPAGVTQRPQKRMKLNQTIYSETPSVQRNYRREVMNRLPTDPSDTVNSLHITPDSDRNVITLGTNIIPNPNQPFQSTGSIGNGIDLTPINPVRQDTPNLSMGSLYRDTQEFELYMDSQLASSVPRTPKSGKNSALSSATKSPRFSISDSLLQSLKKTPTNHTPGDRNSAANIMSKETFTNMSVKDKTATLDKLYRRGGIDTVNILEGNRTRFKKK